MTTPPRTRVSAAVELAHFVSRTRVPCAADWRWWLTLDEHREDRADAIEACQHCPALTLCQRAADELAPREVVQAGQWFDRFGKPRMVRGATPAPPRPKREPKPQRGPILPAVVALLESGPATAADLAYALDVAPASVRHHLVQQPRFVVVGHAGHGPHRADLWALSDEPGEVAA